jgi:hypothetical protein
MKTFIGVNLHQRGQKQTIVEVIKKYSPKKYIQIGYTRDLISSSDIPGIELISYNLNNLQYGKIPELFKTIPLEDNSIDHLKEIEGYSYLLMERLIHDKYNEAYTRTSKKENIGKYSSINEGQQSNSISPVYEFIDKKRFLYDNYRLLNHIFETEKIDFCFLSESPSSYIPYLIYNLAAKNNIQTILTEHIPARGHRVFINDYRKIGIEVSQEYNELIKLKSQVDFKTSIYNSEWERIINGTAPYYMQGKKESNIIRINYTSPYKPSLISKIKKIGNLDYLHYKLKRFDHFNRSEKLRNFYEKLCESPDLNSNFIYATLHLEPEKTSVPLGGNFGDQILMIEMLSYHLPKDFTIYVKENPKQLTNYRSVRYYLRLLEIPNIKLISTSFNSFDLINNSKAVATLTGTVAYEAMALGKPAFIFGYTILQHFEEAWVIRGNDDCSKFMKKLTEKKGQVDVKKFKTFFKAIENIGINIPFYNENEVSEKEFLNRMKSEYFKYIDKLIELK